MVVSEVLMLGMGVFIIEVLMLGMGVYISD